ncbi:serine-rich adhesin for platelets [Parasteatoda tepidariorum]|uniref:serine-rich adhesin for platelets n=1 Tax=Parasteatoda tepidariorum TaxID=114398 RepID=UPI001C71BA1A|nr:uncharacterized protein LOC107456272 [Parasteatoda tepidariorum]XP_042911472.1 uncharacterized protein LOC107456272 [Parasteatoda tepidariorum]
MATRRNRADSSDNPEEDNARKKERLDCAIYKLKEKKGGFGETDESKSKNSVSSANSKNSSKGEKGLKFEIALKNSESESSEIVGTFNEADFRIIPKTEILNLNYCMWENTSNVCWLDASMALLAHNQTLRYECDINGSAHVKTIVKYYNEAICLLNDDSSDWNIEQRLAIAKKFLSTVQDSSLEYLQPILKYNNGDPESAFCSLFNLIREDKTVRKFFEVEYTKSFLCEKCGMNRTTTINKPIITLPKVVAFQPSSPFFVSECPSCKDQEQRIKVSYKVLPKCLIFHFENGAGKGELYPLDFSIYGREYKVTGLMTLEKSEEMTVDHFVSWIRDPSSDCWLECNDLNPEVLKFAAIPPHCISLVDVCMVMFEAFDDLGTIEIKTDESELTEKLNLADGEAEDANIPFIDLSQDIEEPRNRSNNRETPSRKTCGEKNMNVWSDGDDLNFLNSICNSPSDSLSKSNNDSQPYSFMKQLDLKPKTDETQKDLVLLPESQTSCSDVSAPHESEQKNVSLQDTLSPRYTDLIKKLAAQNDDIEDGKILSSDTKQKSEFPKLNTTEKSPLDESLPSKMISCQKLNDNVCNSKDSKKSSPTVVKLVTSGNFQNDKENADISSAEVIESDFVTQQYDKLNQILASKKSTHSKIKFPTQEEINGNKKLIDLSSDFKNGNQYQNQKTDLLAREENNTKNLLDVPNNDKLTGEEILSAIVQAKCSGLDEMSNGNLSDHTNDNSKRSLLPIEVKTTVFDCFQNEGKYIDHIPVSLESMPIFPVEEKTQTITPASQEKDELSKSVTMSASSILLKESQEKHEPDGESSTNLTDFLLKENPYDMALIVKESEEITPETIIKVIRNEKKPLVSSKTSNSPSMTSRSKIRKRRKQRKDFDHLKMKPFSINVEKMTHEEILVYSPRAFESSTPEGSPNSTSTNQGSLSCEVSTEVYPERFNDDLKHDSSQKILQADIRSKKSLGLSSEVSSRLQNSLLNQSNEPSTSGISNKRGTKHYLNQRGKKGHVSGTLAENDSAKSGTVQSIKNKTHVEPNQNCSPISKRGRPKKEKVIITNTLEENISLIEKVKQEPILASPNKKKNLLRQNTKNLLSHSSQDHNIEKTQEAATKNQEISKNIKLHTETIPKMLSCEVGKKWGRKEKQPALDEIKLSTDLSQNNAIDISSDLIQNPSTISIHKSRGRTKKGTDLNVTNSNNALQDHKNLNSTVIGTPVRKSNRKRSDALLALKDNYVVDSYDSKSNIASVESQESIVILKQEKDASQSKISSPDIKNIALVDQGFIQISDEEIPIGKRRNLRKRNCIRSSTSDSDVNPKYEALVEEDSVKLNKNIKNATSSCTSASETELIVDSGDVKGKKRNKRKTSQIKSEACLPTISEKTVKDELKVVETKSNVLKNILPSSIKRNVNQNHPEENVLYTVQSGFSLDNETNEPPPQKKIKTEAVAPVVKTLPKLKRGRKKSLNLIGDSVSNSVDELSPKRKKKQCDSKSGIRRDSPVIVPLPDEKNISYDVAGSKKETTPKKTDISRKKRNATQQLLPSSLNQSLNKSLQSSLPNKKKSNSSYLDMTVDCIVDLYLTKAYDLFGIGCEEYRH